MSLQTRLDSLTEPNLTYIKAYIRHKSLAGLSETSITNYVDQMVVFLKFYGADKDLKLVTKDDIETYIYERRKQRMPSTIFMTVLALRSFFSDLLGKETANEFLDGVKVKVPLVKVREDQLLTADEIKLIIDACYSERDRALISLLYASGCRKGEIIGLKMRDVSFSRYGATIHVNGKTGERDVDIFIGVPEIKAWYNVHPYRDNPDAPFFTTGKKFMPLKSRGFDTIIQRAAERAGVEGKKLNPHAFRHRRATDCAEFMTTADMKEMFGWSDGSDMPSVYVHSSRRAVAEKLMRQAGIKVPEQRMPTSMVRQCPVCGCVNTANAIICVSCNSMLDEKIAVVDKEVREFLRDHMEEILEYKKEKEKNNTK